MKKLILTCALITSASMLSFAQSTQSSVTMTPQNAAGTQAQTARQQQPQPEQMATRRAQMYKQQYNLDDKQYQGVYNAELDYVKEMMDMRGKGQQPTAEQGKQMMATKDAKFQKAMSAEQYGKYTATRAAQQQQAAPAAVPAGK